MKSKSAVVYGIRKENPGSTTYDTEVTQGQLSYLVANKILYCKGVTKREASQLIKRFKNGNTLTDGFSVGDSVKCYLNNCIAEIVRIHSNGDLELSAAGVTLKSNMNSVQRYYGSV